MPKLREVIDLPRRLLSPLWLRPDTTLEQDLADEDLVEFVNLREEETGIPGTIYILTEIGGHGPRVKYYAGRTGKTQASFSVSIGISPRLLASSLPGQITREMAPRVMPGGAEP